MENKRIWDQLRTPPKKALKAITGGRLKGMTDIKPQWRYDALTEVFGPCGEGWNYTIEKLWTQGGEEGQVFAFAQVQFKYKEREEWSESIPGIGGSMLIEKDKWGLHHNDEAFKMAVTDALSVAVKMIGVGSDIYMGNTKGDGGKYSKPSNEPAKKEKSFTRDSFKKIVTEIKRVIGEDKYFEICTSYQVNQASDLEEGSWSEFLKDMEKERDKVRRSQSER